MRERERESKEQLSLMEDQLAVKEKALALMEADLEKASYHPLTLPD